MRKFAGPLLFALSLLSLPSPILAQCGVERWSVKTGTDADVGKINLSSSTAQTIVTMRGWPTPSPIPANNRVSPYETTQWVLNATLTQYKLETDSDYHLVLSDASGNTLIAEIPSPTCVGAGSPFGPGITNARNQFDARFTATSSFQTANIPVQIRGVGMFDFLHGQTGVAPNGIEIHPVLNIVFNPTGSDFTLAASPNSVSVVQGTSSTSTMSTSISGSFNSAIALSASGLPSGATASFSPSSIAAPGSGSSTATITTSTSTPAGTYTVTVTGSGGGTTHTASITLTVTPSGGGGGTEAIVDGGFEAATVTGNSAPGWTGTTNISGDSTIAFHGSSPHGGTNYGALGASNSEVDTLTQTLSIPSTATAASLTFWANVVTSETANTGPYDFCYVEIHNSSGTLLATPLTLNNNSSSLSNNTAGTYFKPAAVDLIAYKGQTIQLVFHATTDSTLPTTFRIDDVSVALTTSGGGDTTPPTTSVTAPANGATVSSTVSVTATASDNIAVTTMEIYIDGALKTSNTSATSLTYSWNTTTFANGSHTIVSKAYDAAGNVGTSPTITVTVSNNSGSQQLLVNPGFETGTATPWVAASGVVTSSTSEAAHTGTWKAWMDGYGAAHTDTLYQQVAIPSTITTATLTFWLHIDTAETSTTGVFDTLNVQVRNSSGTVLATLATYSNLNATTGYVQKTFDLSAYKGQTVQIYLVGVEDSTLQTSFVVDDFALNVQ
jgi:hypothetical protein